jgi:hypothetical protein
MSGWILQVLAKPVHRDTFDSILVLNDHWHLTHTRARAPDSRHQTPGSRRPHAQRVPVAALDYMPYTPTYPFVRSWFGQGRCGADEPVILLVLSI